MVRLISNALLVTMHCVLLQGSKRTVKLVHKPYGPKMCKELCADTTGYFLYVKEDLSCRLASTSSIMNNRSSGSVTCIKEDEMVNGSLTLILIRGNGRCHSDAIGREMSDELELIVNKANATDGYCEALNNACKKGNMCLVQYILSHKLADINCREKLGRTPVMVAARARQASVFDFLVRQGCDLSVMDHRNDSLLHMACKGSDISIVRKLVHSGQCDTEGRGWNKRTPVMTVACYGNERVFDFLVNINCSLTAVDVQNTNILHFASSSGNTGIVNYILEQNISDIESKDAYGRTPLMWAVHSGHVEVFNLLLNKGCNLSITDKKNNILHVACLYGHKHTVKCIVLQNIDNIESKGQSGMTPFLCAAMYGYLSVVQFLVERDCNLTSVDGYQNTALHLACKSGHIDMVKHLFKLGIFNSKVKNIFGETPLEVAELKEHLDVVSFLKPKF